MKRVMNARQSDAFKVEVTLEKDSLVAGVPVTLTVTLQVKQEGAQYVMLEVPVPAVVVMPQNLLISPVLKYIVSILKRKLLSLAKNYR